MTIASITRLRGRRTAGAAACVVVMLGALAGCGDGDEEDTGGSAQTGAALAYDVVIAVCEERLSGTEDMCERVTTSTAGVIYAHALFGRAQGRQVQITVEGPLSAGAEGPPVATVPEDSTWLQGLEIVRDRACTSLPCELVVRANVDGVEVESETFTFIEP